MIILMIITITTFVMVLLIMITRMIEIISRKVKEFTIIIIAIRGQKKKNILR